MRFKEYLKLYESAWDTVPENGFVTDKEEVEKWCERLNIYEGKIEIDDEGQVSVYGAPVLIDHRRLKRLPIKFKYIERGFSIKKCGLRTLLGCPEEVGEWFSCADNRLRSLEGGPKKVGDGYDCSGNILSTLHGSPEIIGGGFDASDNELHTLEGGPKEVKLDYNVQENDITTLKGVARKIGRTLKADQNDIRSLEGIHEMIDEVKRIDIGSIRKGGLGLILIKNLESIEDIGWYKGLSHFDSTRSFSDKFNGWVSPSNILDKYIGRPNDVFECQAELIENGYDDIAVL